MKAKPLSTKGSTYMHIFPITFTAVQNNLLFDFGLNIYS